MKPSTFRAMLFDLDGTLYNQLPLRFLMAMELSVLPVSVVSFSQAKRVVRAIKTFRAKREELRAVGRPTESLDRLQYRVAAQEIEMEEKEMEKIIREWMYTRPLKYLKWCRRRGVEAFLGEAKKKGIKLGVFSDYPAAEKLKALGLEMYMDLVLCATDESINAFKPHPRGFLLACERWRLLPEEVLYIGDRPDVDARGAEMAGMSCMIVGCGHGRETSQVNREEMFTSFHGLQQSLSI